MSGDLGHVDAQGYVHVTGRAKDVIIRGSHNIDPGLVEEALLAHPAIAMAAVVAEPDSYAGEVPVAFVSLRPGQQADPQVLLAEVAPRVYERPAVPKRVTVLPALPVTAVGKLYKPALRLLAIETRLREAFADWDVPVQVRADDRGGTLVAVLTLACADSAARREQVQQRLGAMSLRSELVFAG